MEMAELAAIFAIFYPIAILGFSSVIVKPVL
jgi:hypothetical protein